MRKRKLTKVVVAALSFSLCLGIFAGCEQKDNGDDSVMQETGELKNETSETTLEADHPQDDEMVETENIDATESVVVIIGDTAPSKNEDGSYSLGCELGSSCEYSGRVDYIPMEGYTLEEDFYQWGKKYFYNEEGDSFSVDVGEVTDYGGAYDQFSSIRSEGSIKTGEGVISTPIGDMTYFSEINHYYDFVAISGFVTVDPGHYLEIKNLVKREDYEEVSNDWLIEKLTNFAQGLKAAQ